MKFLTASVGPGLLWTAMIFYLLSMDTSGAGEFSLLKVYGMDKLIHLALFAILAFVLGAYFLSRSTMPANLIVLLMKKY